MKMTHVVRGDDHINNTPRQINIFKALNAEPPRYGHVPMILGEDGKKLSKRHGAVSVMQYKEDGFLKEALLNHLVRLGWSHGDQEVFSLQEMIELFDVSKLSRSAAIFSQDKLIWLNQHYLKNLPVEKVVEQLDFHMQKLGIDYSQGPAITDVVDALKERAKTLVELAESSRYFYQEVEFDEKAAKKNLKPANVDALTRVKEGFARLENWTAESLHNVITAVAGHLDVKMGKVAQPIRVAVTGGTVSPSMGIVLQLVGRERVLARLEKAIAYCTVEASN
jgi:glutamyl-tRNA synthetase